MDRRSLGGVVGKVALGVAHQSGHAGDDDSGASVVFRGGLQEREAGQRAEVDGGDVGIVGAVPVVAGFRVPERLLDAAGGGGGFRAGFGAGDAGGGDEEGEVFLLGGDLLD